MMIVLVADFFQEPKNKIERRLLHLAEYCEVLRRAANLLWWIALSYLFSAKGAVSWQLAAARL